MRGHALSLAGHHAQAMYSDPSRLITFRDCLENRQGLDCYCPGCRRRAYTDVRMLVLNGLGDRNVKRYRPRCRRCGSIGIWSFTGPLSSSQSAVR
jgi:hypothetical protein